jgi:hypothetical protein
MTNGLLEPTILAFVFTPLVVSVTCVARQVLRRVDDDCGGERDAPARVLAWAAGAVPPVRKEWGLAMLAELAAVPGRRARWRFALSCVRAVFFLPRAEAPPTVERRPVLGFLAVAAPPLALPFIYVAAAILDAAGGGSTAVVKVLVVSTAAGLVAGVPLGVASRWRREPNPRLATWGMASSIGTSGYFLVAMRWLAGVD